MSPVVFTNGSTRDWPIDLVDGVSISLDGIGQAHDRMRGRSHAYRKAVRTLETLDAHRIPTHVQMSVSDDTVCQVAELAAVVRAHACVRSLHVAGILPIGAAARADAPRLSARNEPRVLARIADVVSSSGHDLTVTTNIARRPALLDYRDNADQLRLPVIVDAALDSVHLLSQTSTSVCHAHDADAALVDDRVRLVRERVAGWRPDDLPDVVNVERLLLDAVRATSSPDEHGRG